MLVISEHSLNSRQFLLIEWRSRFQVPSCLGAPMLLALAKGEVMALMNYEDEQVLPVQEEEDDEEEYEDELEDEEGEVEALGKKDI